VIAGPAASPLTVRARAPLRIDLGGGIDPDGAMVVAAISLAVHVEVLLGGRTIRLRAEDRDQRVTLSSPSSITYDGRLDRPKAALNMLPVTGGIEMLTRVDAPDDSGLGVPGALNVALVAALALCRQERYNAAELAELAWTLETTELKRPLDREDTYVPAFGGVHLVTRREGRVEGRAVDVTADRLADLAAHLIVAYLGRGYVSGTGTGNREARVADSGLATSVATALGAGDWRRLGQVFDEHWHRQQRLDPLLSAPPTRAIVETARAAGAWGLKATTARSGGSLLVLCDPRARSQVVAALRDRGAVLLPCAFDPAGATSWTEGGEEG
jgi:D-glycero-alpha-D-manno-heptose-7-phosphate kinase